MRTFRLPLLTAVLLAACSNPSQQPASTAPAPAHAVLPAGLWDGETPRAAITDSAAPAPVPAGALAMPISRQLSVIAWKGVKFGSHSHTGTISLAGGLCYVRDGQLAAGSVDIDMNSITNTDLTDSADNADLVGHLKDPDFFDAARFPLAQLVITGTAPGGPDTTMISGNLTLKGITHQITFPARVEASPAGLSASARFSFDRARWDVRYDSKSFFENLGDKFISDDIELHLVINAAPAPVAQR
ncbi:MAG: YceI family protein [Bacteroidia bacterium]|nr:YceI family protein [Bacteroidia bacterium]